MIDLCGFILVSLPKEPHLSLECKMIAIVDHAAGNLFSVERAFRYLGMEPVITADPRQITQADRIVIPGVGRAGSVMAELERTGMADAVRTCFQQGKPILGICIGIQIVFEWSEEDQVDCLGLIPGQVRRFPVNEAKEMKVPQIGWNEVKVIRPHPLFEGIEEPAYFYFVNSYYVFPGSKDVIVGQTQYGVTFASAVASGSLIATQFHLEKSGTLGLRALNNFCHWRD